MKTRLVKFNIFADKINGDLCIAFIIQGICVSIFIMEGRSRLKLGKACPKDHAIPRNMLCRLSSPRVHGL